MAAADGNVMRPMRAGGPAEDLHYDKHSNMQAGLWGDSHHLLRRYLSSAPTPGPPGGCVRVADYGCSTGKNSIAAVADVKKWIEDTAIVAAAPAPNVMAFFCDLPANDFNGLFRRLEGADPGYFAAGVPGSFYDQLFPRGFVHVGICNVALHWASQVPPEVARGGRDGAASPFWNPNTIWLPGCTSEPVIEAYRRQAAADLRTFLSCRAAELAPGGALWFLAPARTDPDPAMRNVPGNVSQKFYVLIIDAWRDLIRDGQLSQASLDTFNLPVYHRSAQEIRDGVQELDGQPLRIQLLEELPAASPPGVEYRGTGDAALFAEKAVAISRVVMEPMIAEHIGWEKSGLLFARARRNVAARPDAYVQSKDYTYIAAILVRKGSLVDDGGR